MSLQCFLVLHILLCHFLKNSARLRPEKNECFYQICGSGGGGSGPFPVEAEAEARKFYRFRFHIVYFTLRVT